VHGEEQDPDAPEISIVVLSWNTADLLEACLRSIQADGSPHTREIIVVDNDSADDSADRVEARFPEVRLIRNSENLLYAEGNNQGARAARGRFLCLLNSDTEVQPGALDGLRDFLVENPDYGIASPKMVYPDGRVQMSCRRFPRMLDTVIEDTWLHRTRFGQRRLGWMSMHDFDHLSSRDVQQPLGACMMTRRQEFADLGMFDPELSLYFNDVELCQRYLESGLRIRFLADLVVHHHEGASTSKRRKEFGDPLFERNRLAYYRKRKGLLGSCFIRCSILARGVAMTLRITFGRSYKGRDKLRAIRASWAVVRSSLSRNG